MYTTLISPEQLLANLHNNNWRIVDCRFDLADTEAGRRAYRKSHLPGAVYAHLDEDLSAEIIPGRTGRHPLPEPEEAARRLGRLGIGDRTQVVVYDDRGGGVAARLWWMLRWLGHEAVAVLDGGWQAWLELSYPLETTPVEPVPDTLPVRLREDWTLDAGAIERIRQDGDYQLVDSRTPERYRGEEEPIDPVAGHIPGAVNVPFVDNLDGGRFRGPEELRRRFREALGDTPEERTVFYCGSGVTACHNVLAYAHAGLGAARLYPGSWSEWIADESRPVEKEE